MSCCFSPVLGAEISSAAVRLNRGLTFKLYYEYSHFTVSLLTVCCQSETLLQMCLTRHAEKHTASDIVHSQRKVCKQSFQMACERGRAGLGRLKLQGGVTLLQLMENVTIMNG